jgi:hypothetical protein
MSAIPEPLKRPLVELVTAVNNGSNAGPGQAIAAVSDRLFDENQLALRDAVERKNRASR